MNSNFANVGCLVMSILHAAQSKKRYLFKFLFTFENPQNIDYHKDFYFVFSNFHN